MNTFIRAAAAKVGDLKLKIFFFSCAVLFALSFSGCAGTYYAETAYPESRYNTYYAPDFYPYYPYYSYYGGAYYSEY